MEKFERVGCPKPVVGLVIPTGYSFNLDGTSIYMTMAALFVAQASGVHLSFGQQLSVLGILLLTSKGAAAVTGSHQCRRIRDFIRAEAGAVGQRHGLGVIILSLARGPNPQRELTLMRRLVPRLRSGRP
jgi:hypothetical protein